MYIDELDYSQNAKEIAKSLDDYTRTKSPKSLETPREKLSFVLKDNDKIMSRLTASLSFNGLHIELFFTDSSSRGMGYGTKILTHVESLAKKKGCHYVVLETMSFNAPKFYLKNGYEVIKKVQNSPIDGEDQYFMFKKL